MIEFTDTQLSIFLELTDNKGHAEWNLSQKMKKTAGNLNPILITLRNQKRLYYKERRNTNPKSKHPNSTEKAYYITNEIEVLSSIMFLFRTHSQKRH